MAQIQVSADAAKQIAEAKGNIDIVDETGAVIASCTPIKFPHSPYTREEVEAAREDARRDPAGGRSLAEIMARLNRLAGESS